MPVEAPNAPPPALPTPPPPPAPTTQINVSSMPQQTLSDAPRPGSARERLNQDLAKLANKRTEPPKATAPPPEPPKDQKVKSATPPPPTDPPPTPKAPEEDPLLEEAEQPTQETQKTETQAKAEPDPKKEKVSPWKLMDQWKDRATLLEKELADLKGKFVPEEERKTFTEKLTKAEKRAMELEEEIRFVNYEKSSEFKDKYDAPFQQAWKTAMADLSELTVEDALGNSRAITADDLVQLASLPLRQRKEMATQMFGDFADDVMAHVKQIRDLSSARHAALEEARKTGLEREKTKQAETLRKSQEIQTQISSAWEKESKAILHDQKYGEYFRPVEGDQEGNQSLAKGFEMVDNALQINLNDPSLSPEARANAVRRYATIRARAAATGRLIKWVTNLRSENAELKKQLNEYKESTPPAGGSVAKPDSAPANAWSSVTQALRNLAR